MPAMTFTLYPTAGTTSVEVPANYRVTSVTVGGTGTTFTQVGQTVTYVLAPTAGQAVVIVGTGYYTEEADGVTAETGGLRSVFRLPASAATTNPNLVKAGAGRLYYIRGYNNTAALKYLKVYNKNVAPVVGTDVPYATFPMKPNDVLDVYGGDYGFEFDTGIAFAITANVADADTTAIAANDVVGLNLFYA